MCCYKIISNSFPSVIVDGNWLKILKRNAKKLKLNKDGVLVKEDEGNERVVLPKSMRPLIYEHLHVDMGHIGAEKVWELAKKRVFWPRMQEDIETFVAEKCKVCCSASTTSSRESTATKHHHVCSNGTCTH